MHDLAVDAIKTVSDEKRVRVTLLLTCIDLTTAEPSVIWDFGWTRDLISRGVRLVCQTFVGLLWAVGQFLQASHLKSITSRRR